jgi:hypothetical protein
MAFLSSEGVHVNMQMSKVVQLVGLAATGAWKMGTCDA